MFQVNLFMISAVSSNQELPTLMYDRHIETQRCWEDLSPLRQSQMNIIRQTKKHMANEKHYLISETAKVTHSSSRARMMSGSLHHMRSSDDRDTSGTKNILFLKKNARKTTRLRAHILQRSSHNVAKYARHAKISDVTWLWHHTVFQISQKTNKARLAQTHRSVERQWREKQASSLAKTDRRNHDQKQRQNTRIIWATMKDVTWDFMNCIT